MALKFIRSEKGEIYGQIAFTGVILGSFTDYWFRSKIEGEPWQIWVTFLLGAAFGFLGIFSCYLLPEKPDRRTHFYFLAQLCLCIVPLYVSPVRGFFGILPLPLASQAAFTYRPRIALPIALSLYAASAFVYFGDYGWGGFLEALVSYAPGYLFTIIFSFVTKQAVVARLRAVALSEELEAANAQLKAHAAETAELATTRERNRLAREIHDGLGHYLTVINVQLEAAATLVERDPGRAKAAIAKSARLAQEALDDVRQSVGSLRTDQTRPPLPELLRNLAGDAGLPVEFELQGDARPLPPKIEHAIFRAAQEGLTNVRKHAAANRAELSLDFSQPAAVHLRLSDDGRGLPADVKSGFGLQGMRERITGLGGTLELGPATQGGFCIQISMPT